MDQLRRTIPQFLARYRRSDYPVDAAFLYGLYSENVDIGDGEAEIMGWDIGGIDRGHPQYRPDPGLGTPEGFRQALAELKKLGVHPLIFANIQFSDTAIPLFREKLRRDAIQGRWADDLPLAGWGEGTISARMGLSHHDSSQSRPSGVPQLPFGPVRPTGKGWRRRLPTR